MGELNLDHGSRAIHANVSKSITRSKSCNLGPKITLPVSALVSEDIAVNNQGTVKETEGKKNIRKPKKTAKGVLASSVVQ